MAHSQRKSDVRNVLYVCTTNSRLVCGEQRGSFESRIDFYRMQRLSKTADGAVYPIHSAAAAAAVHSAVYSAVKYYGSNRRTCLPRFVPERFRMGSQGVWCASYGATNALPGNTYFQALVLATGGVCSGCTTQDPHEDRQIVTILLEAGYVGVGTPGVAECSILHLSAFDPTIHAEV